MKPLSTKFAVGLIAAICLLSAGIAAGQIFNVPLVVSIGSTDAFQDIPAGVSQSTNVYASAVQLRGYVLAQGGVRTGTPTLTTSGSGCGGSAATVAGTDVSGIVTEGSTASTSCVITFSKAFVTAPECFVSLNNVADTALKCSTSTTAATVTQTSASSNSLNYLIVGAPGG